MTIDEIIFKFLDDLENGYTGPVNDSDPIHGKLIECKSDAFNDILVYEDGYEYRYYHGD